MKPAATTSDSDQMPTWRTRLTRPLGEWGLLALLLAGVVGVPAAYQSAWSQAQPADVRAAVDAGEVGRLARMSLDRLNAPVDNGHTPLMLAASLGRHAVAAHLLSRGVDVNFAHPRKGTALMIAAHRGDAALVAELLRHGASVHPTTDTGADALACAVVGGSVACTRTLLDAGAPVYQPARTYPLLHAAAAAGDNPDLLRLLLSAGADPDTRTPDGSTALHSLAEEGAEQCIRTLLNAGADPRAADRHGRTPRDIASRLGHHSVAQLFDAAAAQ